MSLIQKWLIDLDRRINEYVNKHPEGRMQEYFIDSGTLLALIYDSFEYDSNKIKFYAWLWLERIANIYVYPTGEWYNRCVPNASAFDKWGCYNILRELDLLFKLLERNQISLRASVFDTICERVPQYGNTLQIPGNLIKTDKLYSACWGYHVFSRYYSLIPSKYENQINVFLNQCKTYIEAAIENYKEIFTEKNKSYWLYTRFLVSIRDLSINKEKILKIKNYCFQRIQKDLEDGKITRVIYLPSIYCDLLNLGNIELAKQIYGKLGEFPTYNGHMWSLLPRYALKEYIILKHKNTSEIESILSKNLLPKEDISSLELILRAMQNFLYGIDEDSSLKTLIKIEEKNIKEVYFRDYYRRSFKSLGHDAEAEFPNRTDHLTDLVIKDPKTDFQISVEFKVWKRNFDKKPPIEELLDNMGSQENFGILHIINPNLSSIDASIKQELIEEHPLFVENSLKLRKNHYNYIYEASYNYKEHRKTILFFVFNIRNFYR